MKNDELNQIIENQVESKVLALQTWKPIRWQGGRLYYETTLISREIASYDIDTKILFLEKLLLKKYVVQDNWPHSAPDVTEEFKNWIINSISKLKIEKLSLQNNLNNVQSSKKKRLHIPEKTKRHLQKEVNSQCPFCSNIDVHHLQIHHIDENRENNSFANLLMVCANCHSKITKGDISQAIVMKKKQELSLAKS